MQSVITLLLISTIVGTFSLTSDVISSTTKYNFELDFTSDAIERNSIAEKIHRRLLRNNGEISNNEDAFLLNVGREITLLLVHRQLLLTNGEISNNDDAFRLNVHREIILSTDVNNNATWSATLDSRLGAIVIMNIMAKIENLKVHIAGEKIKIERPIPKHI
jgi:hypothetical protein